MAKRSRRTSQDRYEAKVVRGEQQLKEDARNKEFQNDWQLDWFTPKGFQIDCVDSIERNTFTIIDGPSGTGKTTTALWVALHALKNREYRQLLYIKNPSEVGDDKIGFLSGDEQDKLAAHMDTVKRIFHTFMSKNKLECDLSKETIRLTIPNFLLGATFDNSIILIDECQIMSPNTVKLLLERCGKSAKYIILGDSNQRYAVTNRKDGFSDLIERTTVPVTNTSFRTSKYPNHFGYVKMNRHDNQRSEGSKLINLIYEEI